MLLCACAKAFGKSIYITEAVIAKMSGNQNYKKVWQIRTVRRKFDKTFFGKLDFYLQFDLMPHVFKHQSMDTRSHIWNSAHSI